MYFEIIKTGQLYLSKATFMVIIHIETLSDKERNVSKN